MSGRKVVDLWPSATFDSQKGEKRWYVSWRTCRVAAAQEERGRAMGGSVAQVPSRGSSASMLASRCRDAVMPPTTYSRPALLKLS